jgi:O-antigen ligase
MWEREKKAALPEKYAETVISMSTKLSILGDRIIEASWLAVLVATPLFFNVHSSRIFEPDKIALLRSIALVMVLAWLVKGLESARLQKKALDARPTPSRGQTLRGHDGENPARAAPQARHSRASGNPGKSQVVRSSKSLLLLALLFLADYAFATATSIAPCLSLWGSYERLQGLYTAASYFVIFLSLLALLRTQEQLQRLLTTVLVVSLPVSLYGIIQHFGIDPVPWKEDVSQRVTSTLGNSIFVAAFLIMVVPLTLYRFLEAGRSARRHEDRGTTTVLHKPLLPILRLATYGVLLSAQLVCIFLSQSRGPWLGLLSGLLLFALLWTLVHRRWRWAVLITGSSFAIALLLAVIALPNSPLTFMREVPYVGRFTHMFEGTGRVRVLIWQGAVQLITANPLRTATGYGPETMLVAYYPYYPPALSQVESRTAFPDRSHNETFDVLVTTGLVGFAIHFLLFTSLFYYGLQETGAIRAATERRVFLGLWLAGGTGAVLLARLLDHSWRFGGVAFPLAFMTWDVATTHESRGKVLSNEFEGLATYFHSRDTWGIVCVPGMVRVLPSLQRKSTGRKQCRSVPSSHCYPLALGSCRSSDGNHLWDRYRLYAYLLLGVCGAADRGQADLGPFPPCGGRSGRGERELTTQGGKKKARVRTEEQTLALEPSAHCTQLAGQFCPDDAGLCVPLSADR